MAKRQFSNFTSVFKKKNSYDCKMMITKGGRTTIDESYNRLKDNLLFLGSNGINVLQVEASISGEGKTTTVCNLGVSLSFNNKKVVIVDFDFRKPKVGLLFGLEETVGLGDFFANESNFDQIVKSTEYGVDVITRGKEIHNPSLVLDSHKMEELMSNLREKYDFVLLDCSPVLLTSDYMHVARYADGILLVVGSNFTKRTAVKESVELLKKVNLPIVGSVMTMVESDVVQYGYEKE